VPLRLGEYIISPSINSGVGASAANTGKDGKISKKDSIKVTSFSLFESFIVYPPVKGVFYYNK
jgi:hypothetical protein